MGNPGLINCERILAWLLLIKGFITDDVVGLNTVLGKNTLDTTWIPTFPVYRIGNKFIRIPLSFLLGLITLYFFAAYAIFPLFWPLLWAGPYKEFKLFSLNEDIILKRPNMAIETPFIINPGDEYYMTIIYKPILKIWMTYFYDAKVSYLKNYPMWRKSSLPLPSQYVWANFETLKVKVNNRWRQYKVNYHSIPTTIEFKN
ncbi:hypothetical protein ACFLUO_08765 [Chloroflexota bacterium]